MMPVSPSGVRDRRGTSPGRPSSKERMPTRVVIASIVMATIAASGCGSASITRAPGPVATGRIQGSVTAGPTCPVEQVGRPCLRQPIQGRIFARRADGSTQTVALSRTGYYRMTLPAGIYVLNVETGGVLPRCPSITVTVDPTMTVKADISCDTGIR